MREMELPSMQVFDRIYRDGNWGRSASGHGTSGRGSLPTTAKPYLDYLQAFLDGHPQIRTVVDVGCGDWQFSRFVRWGDRTYLGFDAAKRVIEQNERLYGSERIRFLHWDPIEAGMPVADLLLCKDVLQHLPNETILRFAGQLNRFRYALITNDVHPLTGTSDNRDCSVGGYRPVDLTAAPFHVRATRVLTYCPYGREKKVCLLVGSDL